MAQYDADRRPGESMETWYKRIARTADDRLRALESYQHDRYFKPAIKWAYAVAENDIKKWSGQHAKRFNTKPPEDPERLLAKISDIQKFLKSPTSTKSGIRESYQKRADTLNKDYPGANFSWKDMAVFYESGTWSALDNTFGSKTAMKIVAKIRKEGKKYAKQLKKEVEEAKEQNQKIIDKKLLDRNVKKALSMNDVSMEDLFI